MDENSKNTSPPLLLTFKEKKTPEFIEIPEEQANTRAYK